VLKEREDLFVGQFPGCLIFADKTVYEHGDYKNLTRVTNAGNIHYDVFPITLPEWVRKLVEAEAEKKRAKWDEYVEREIKGRPLYFYEKILDALDTGEFLDWSMDHPREGGAEDWCRALIPVYRKHC